ncbi:MAG: aminoacyl-tRNA hydrolase [Clostridia bacterium]|nr:aminoacyl-tRNA hydrolase [Clostridia bacterium]
MYVIVGLGNPGAEYAETRHNVGFMVIDELARRLNVNISKKAHRSLIGEARIDSERVILVKPQTFMNLSGFAVCETLWWYKLDWNNLIVIYDDIDLAVGTLRIREKGSSGTHNGMRHIIAQLGSSDFTRVRVGIGTGKDNLISYVLGKPIGDEKETLKTAIDDAVSAVELICTGHLTEAQAKYNKKPKSKKEEPNWGENKENGSNT